MTKQQLQESVLELLDEDQEVLLADGYEDAFIGISFQTGNPPHAVYDRKKCIDILVADGMDEEEADEYFVYNVQGTRYDGVAMPAFLVTL